MTKVYTYKEYQDLNPIFSMAEYIWAQANNEYGKHEGSCIKGEGFEIQVMLPRKRKPRYIRVVRSSGKYQGSITIETAAKQVEKYLKDMNIDFRYNPGMLD